MDYEIDSLDRKILVWMQKDSRMPYLEIARELKVSGGTIHQRVKKMKDAGIIKGTQVLIDREKLGLKLQAFIGIQVDKAHAFRRVSERLVEIPEILAMHYTTGEFSLFIKVAVRETADLHRLLAEKIQTIENIQSTQTVVVLSSLLEREVDLMI
tara:strand:- start:177 stop:638 length:462 start_codon:yes stop_codon:yes gene_type:complete